MAESQISHGSREWLQYHGPVAFPGKLLVVRTDSFVLFVCSLCSRVDSASGQCLQRTLALHRQQTGGIVQYCDGCRGVHTAKKKLLLHINQKVSKRKHIAF